MVFRIEDAIEWIIKEFGGIKEEPYPDRVNEQFKDKTVGYYYTRKKRMFLLTCRREIFTKTGKGAMTLMNASEILNQLKEGRDRIVVYNIHNVNTAYVFNTFDIIRSILDGDAELLRLSTQSENSFNIPLKIAKNMKKILEEEKDEKR